MEGGLLYVIIIGAVCGWIANVLMSDGYGLILSIIIGIAGSFVGHWAFGKLGISIGSGVISDIITGASGAIIILFILGLLKGGRGK